MHRVLDLLKNIPQNESKNANGDIILDNLYGNFQLDISYQVSYILLASYDYDFIEKIL